MSEYVTAEFAIGNRKKRGYVTAEFAMYIDLRY